MRDWFGLLWSGECKDITEDDLRRSPRKGPPSAPRKEKVTPLSEIMKEDICPIKLTTFYGKNSPASEKAARRLMDKLKAVVPNPATLSKLEHFEIDKDFPRDRWQASE